jgi:hypothetical protein
VKNDPSKKQDRQCTYKRNIVAHSCNHCCIVKAIIITYCERVCSPSYPACSAHSPYCHMWTAPLYNIFPYYLINGKIFEKKKLLNTKYVFWFHLQFLSEIFLILRRTERDVFKNVYCSSFKVPVFCVRF